MGNKLTTLSTATTVATDSKQDTTTTTASFICNNSDPHLIETDYNCTDKRCKASFKTVLLGPPRSGKTKLFSAVKTGQVSSNHYYTQTTGFSLHQHYLRHEKNCYKIQLWDTTGHVGFKDAVGGYLKSAQIVLLVCDYLSLLSLTTALPEWLADVDFSSLPDNAVCWLMVDSSGSYSAAAVTSASVSTDNVGVAGGAISNSVVVSNSSVTDNNNVADNNTVINDRCKVRLWQLQQQLNTDYDLSVAGFTVCDFTNGRNFDMVIDNCFKHMELPPSSSQQPLVTKSALFASCTGIHGNDNDNAGRCHSEHCDRYDYHSRHSGGDDCYSATAALAAETMKSGLLSVCWSQPMPM